MRIKHLFTCAIPAISIAATIPPISTAHNFIEPRSPIINGQPVPPGHSIPSAVIILYRTPYGPTQICGGTLIGPNAVLTARHCVEKLQPVEILVHAGTASVHSGLRPNVERIHLSNEADAAILMLYQPLTTAYNNRNIEVGYAQLPNYNRDLPPGAKAIIAGWGQDARGRLQSQLLTGWGTILRRDVCAAATGMAIDYSLVCSYHPTSMAWIGDSGSLLFDGSNRLFGIISKGFPPPDGYAPILVSVRVAHLVGWIYSVTGIKPSW